MAVGVVVGLILGAGCGQSLFDSHGAADGGHGDDGGGGGDDGGAVPSTCTAPCLGDAAMDFGSITGAGHAWRYLEDHRDRTWTVMTGDPTARTGVDLGNHITTCAANPEMPGCQAMPGALLISSAGATTPADPAIELTVAKAQVIQLALRARLAGGPSQEVRIYRNTREDVLFTGTATGDAELTQAITLDALPGDRFLVAVAPTAAGGTVALQLFVSATGAVFPATCQIAMPFSAPAAGNTADNLCGDDFTHGLFDGADSPTPLAAGPIPEHTTAADFTANNYLRGAATLSKTGDTTVQFWIKLRAFVESYDAWPFSDLDFDSKAGGGLGIAITNRAPPNLDVTTCTSGDLLTFDDALTPYPMDGAWHFVRVVQRGPTLYVCLDGKRKGSFAVAPGHLQSPNPPTFGSNVRWLPQGGHFDGELDDVRVLTGALPCD